MRFALLLVIAASALAQPQGPFPVLAPAIPLAAGNTIQGVAGSATAITYTIFGATSPTPVQAGASYTYSVLAQGQLGNSNGTLYTVPAGNTAFVQQIVLANATGSTVTGVLIAINGSTATAANVMVPSRSIPGNAVMMVTPGASATYDTNGNQLAANVLGQNGNALIPTYYVTGGGTAQAQTATLSPAATSLAAGLLVCWTPTAANTATAPTLAVNGLTAKTIVRRGAVGLVANDLTTTTVACAMYNGTNFELWNPQAADVQVSSVSNTAFYTAQASSIIPPTAVADVSGQFFYGQIFIPTTVTLTGACLMNGSGALADKQLYVLWNSAGTVLANSAVAGVTQSGTNQYQCQNFLSTVVVQGPASYFIGTQSNGATAASLYTYPTASAPTGYVTGFQAGVFGTVVNITSPATSFTAGKGPVMTVF